METPILFAVLSEIKKKLGEFGTFVLLILC